MTDVDVAIVGAGPVGLSLSCLLSEAGVSSRLIERRGTLHQHPQAHVIATRTMEIFRELGIADEVAARAPGPEKMAGINWVESVTGLHLGRLDLTKDVDGIVERLHASPVFTANLAQNELEPIVLNRARELGGAQAVTFDAPFSGYEETADGVRVCFDGANGADSFTARYLVGCDGAASAVRRAAGIEMDGPASLEEFVGLQFEADLTGHLEGRLGPVFWIHAPGFRATLIGYDIAKTWVLMVSRSVFGDAGVDEDKACELIRQALGTADVPFSFKAAKLWNMSAQVAQTYRAGPVFLAGDAAHRFPPTGGLGMNSGIQDAHNLAWKLALVLNGKAPDSLLDSYEAERRPIAQTYTDHSVHNAADVFRVSQVIGEFDGPEAVAAGLACLRKGGEEAQALQAEIDQAIEDQRAHYSFLGLDLGYVYRTGALIADLDRELPDMVNDRVAATRYRGRIAEGARFPHVPLNGPADVKSTLDLVGHGRFTLLTTSQGAAWIDAARALFDDAGLAGDAVMIGPDCAIKLDADVTGALDRLERCAAILVRPDGMVGYIANANDNPEAALKEALEAILQGGAAP